MLDQSITDIINTHRIWPSPAAGCPCAGIRSQCLRALVLVARRWRSRRECRTASQSCVRSGTVDGAAPAVDVMAILIVAAVAAAAR